ncbi:hypothetical protein [Catellatospora methionotrophica]|uniref:hypothetical protein n=1 Tax=Catellatospora methionotrophica TaxID=121620 RepID=UPI0033C31358
MSSSVVGLVPIHIGQPEPGSERERQHLAMEEHARDRGHSSEPLRVPAGVDWARHGLAPKWLGMDTSDCAVAIEPGHFTGRGDQERDRFLAAAARRGELALVISVIGDGDSPGRNLFGRYGSVSVSDSYTRVLGKRLPEGSRPTIVDGLTAADRDLALRLLSRPDGVPWWALELQGSMLHGTNGKTDYPATGHLDPILVDALGAPVAAAWVSPAGDVRWYVIPDEMPWDNVLGWLIHSALPSFAPAVLRRARSPHFLDPDLQTIDELRARQALSALEARHAEELEVVRQELRVAEEAAETVRYGLLYGSDKVLVDAVARVFAAAGIHTVNLDEELGATKSADLLASRGDGRPGVLVEVKAAGRAAQEHLLGHLARHLVTWPQLRPQVPVDGGVLVVNHHQKAIPADRPLQVYTRPETVESLPFTVLSTIELFGWWRAGDWAAIRAAVLGTDGTADATQMASTVPESGELQTASKQRWWQRRG